jgi:hypothetical protein
MTANDFTTKSHVSCNGCYFNKTYAEKQDSYLHERQKKKHDILCTDSKYEELILGLWKLYGSCLTNNAIFILKDEKSNK